MKKTKTPFRSAHGARCSHLSISRGFQAPIVGVRDCTPEI